MDHPQDPARAGRKLRCRVKPMGKSVGVGTSIKKQEILTALLFTLVQPWEGKVSREKQESGEREKL